MATDPAGGEKKREAPKLSWWEEKVDPGAIPEGRRMSDVLGYGPGGPGTWLSSYVFGMGEGGATAKKEAAEAQARALPDPSGAGEEYLRLPGSGQAQTVPPDFSGVEAGIRGLPDFAVTRSYEKRVEKAPWTKEQYAEEQRKAGEADAARWRLRRDVASSVLGQKEDIGKYSKKLRRWEMMAQKESARLRPQMEALDAKKKELLAKFENAQTDPNRFLNEMPWYGKVLAAAVGGLIQDPKLSYQIMNQAVERDIAQQRAEIHKNLQMYNLTVEQSRDIWKRWSQLEAQKKDLAADMFRLSGEKAKLDRELTATDARILEAKRADDKWLAQMREKAVDKVVERGGRTTTDQRLRKQAMLTSLAQQVAKSTGQKELKSPQLKALGEAHETVTSTISQMRSIGDLAKNMAKQGRNRYKRWAKTTMARFTGGITYNQALAAWGQGNYIMAPIVKMYFGGHASDQDRKYIDPIMLKMVDNKESMLDKLEMWKKAALRRMQDKIGKANGMRAMSPGQDRQWYEMGRRALERSHQVARQIVMASFD